MTLLQNQQLNDDDLELLSAYIDNQLMASERGVLEERLRHEPNLRTALEELRGTVAVLRELEPLRPPRSFILDPVAFAPRPSPLFGWMRLGATLASVLLALTFAVDLVRLGGSSSAPAAAAPTEASANTAAERSALTEATAAPAAMSGAAAAPTAAPAAPAAAPPAPAAEAPAAEPTAAPAAAAAFPTAAPLAAAGAPAPTPATAGTQQSDTALTAPAADLQPSATPGQAQSYSAPEPLATAAPAGAASGQAPVQQQASRPALRPIRVIQIGLASLALLLGLGALWARRQNR